MNPSGMDREFIQPHVFSKFDDEAFEKWYNHLRPDVVLVTGLSVGDLQKWLKKKGMAAVNFLDSLLTQFDFGIPLTRCRLWLRVYGWMA